MDVNSLYTSITHEKGIAASKLLLENSGKSTTYVRLCIDLLRLVLYENYFLYEYTYYVQCQGTAMGSNVAPAYANAYMNSFEESFVYTDIRYEEHINCYLRYIDDIFFIWKGSIDTLQAFYQTLNSIYPELQFTMHFDPTQISFLDTLVRKDDQGFLSTDLFCKPTDCNSLLHYSSSHPKATRNSLPRSQFTRVARIVSDPDILPTRLEDMSQKFRERRYAQCLLDREKARALQPPPVSPSNTNENRVPFVHTFHPFMPKVERVINKHWPLLRKAYPNITSFSAPPLMCNRRAPNIRDKLVRADIGSLRPTTTQTTLTPHCSGTFPCLNCASCSNVIRSDSVTHPRTDTLSLLLISATNSAGLLPLLGRILPTLALGAVCVCADLYRVTSGPGLPVRRYFRAIFPPTLTLQASLQDSAARRGMRR
ncbi:unnamed protein product [Ranitomeya imitator]|uniref:Reverse transcriptase domain-containing protein n=1 Tax=Ranitomeya imitator TaxID=111125 RepID=A0ABN9M3L4_9NEOB|nr:unnamed protein product [Ranitomeya imitator]